MKIKNYYSFIALYAVSMAVLTSVIAYLIA